jgi:Zn ribbon nucleic-acid-binding protein
VPGILHPPAGERARPSTTRVRIRAIARCPRCGARDSLTYSEEQNLFTCSACAAAVAIEILDERAR